MRPVRIFVLILLVKLLGRPRRRWEGNVTEAGSESGLNYMWCSGELLVKPPQVHQKQGMN
jgi:hypothetical protein